jgi:hypothetical protein
VVLIAGSGWVEGREVAAVGPRPPKEHQQGQGDGDFLAHGHLGSPVKVAYIDFERDESQGNLVITHLQYRGSVTSAPIQSLLGII